MAFAPRTNTERPDYSVPQAGTDGISSLAWSPNANILISTNWDGGVRCWEVQESQGQMQALPKAQGKIVVIIIVYVTLDYSYSSLVHGSRCINYLMSS